MVKVKNKFMTEVSTFITAKRGLMMVFILVAIAVWMPSGAQTLTNGFGIGNTATASAVQTMTGCGMVEGPAGDTLLQGYIAQCFDDALPAARRSPVLRRSAVATLTGNDLNAYYYLKEFIENVAAGNISSTAITIDLNLISGKTEWSAEELGLESLSGGQLTQETIKWAIAQSSFNIERVLHALLSDMPYECYWFDKAKGWKWSCSYSNNSETLSLTDYRFTMYVAQEYAVQGNNVYYPTMFNTSTVQSVNAAVNHALNIVQSSYGTAADRLAYYRDKVCELTTYNTQAANTSNWPYGNAWQLVWVFDGDPLTSVVCEGYAKAFKYLCDLSDLPGVECLTVSGYLTSSSTSGGHMWNVVRMDDGRNYLVDLTNCDAGTVGYPDALYMRYGPTGNCVDGYMFNVKSSVLTYQYMEQTLEAFGEAALTISDRAYDPANATGVRGIANTEGDTKGAEVYALDGMRQREPQRGVNIVRTADGTTRKVLKKK